MNRKAEADYQTIIATAGNNNFRNIEMETIWKLVETCIDPIAMYGGETWKPTKKESDEINKEAIIGRRLMVETGTPNESFYIETGQL